MPKILLVEDDITLQKMYKDKLQKEGYEVLQAYDGKEGYEVAKSERPDFILLDLMMPRTDGVASLKLLKENEETSSIPVAILSVVPEDSFEVDTEVLLKDKVAYWRKDLTKPSYIVSEIDKFLKKSK